MLRITANLVRVPGERDSHQRFGDPPAGRRGREDGERGWELGGAPGIPSLVLWAAGAAPAPGHSPSPPCGCFPAASAAPGESSPAPDPLGRWKVSVAAWRRPKAPGRVGRTAQVVPRPEGARSEAHGRPGRTPGRAQRDPPRRSGISRTAGRVRVEHGPPALTSAQTSIPALARPAAQVPARPRPGSRPELTWSAVVGGRAAPRPRRASAGPSARGVPGRARVTIRGPPIAPVRGRTLSAAPAGQPSARAARAQSRPAGAATAPSPRPPLFPLVRRPAAGADWTSPLRRRRPPATGGVRLCRSRPLVEPTEARAPAETYAAVAQAAGRPLPAAFEDVPRPMRLAREAGRAWRPIPGLGPVGSLATPKFPGILLQRLLLAPWRHQLYFSQSARGAFCCPPVLQTGNPPRR